MAFDRLLAALRSRPPAAVATALIIALDVGLFVLTATVAGTASQIPAGVLSAWGGNYGNLTLSSQPWRLLSSVFLHGSLLHLALNMLVLYQIGQLVERIFGTARYLILYLGTGMLASLASVWWRQDVVSIGASGAIFGVFGGLLAFLLVHRSRLPASEFNRLRTMTLSFVGYSLLLGFAIPGVDNAAHVGGVLGGLLLGWVLAPPAARRVGLGLGVVALLAALVWLDIERPPRHSPAIGQLIDSQPALAARESEILEALNAGRLSRKEALAVIERELKPNWDRLIAGLQAAGADGDEGAEALLAYARLERSALEALVLALSTGHTGWLSTAAVLRAEASVALSSYVESRHRDRLPH